MCFWQAHIQIEWNPLLVFVDSIQMYSMQMYSHSIDCHRPKPWFINSRAVVRTSKVRF